MPVDPNHKHADVPHDKTVMAKGWTYGCHSSKVGARPLDKPKPIVVPSGRFPIRGVRFGDGDYVAVVGLLVKEHTTHWLTKDHEGNPLKCGHVKKFRLQDPQCIGCANRD